jgi:hypothetical protein
MFGGKRERDYVMTGETNYSYPSTLGVGNEGYQMHTLGGKIWKPKKGALNKPTENMEKKFNDIGKAIGGKKYTTKSFVNDVNTLGKLIPKSTRQTITQKTNDKIAGAGRRGRQSKRPVEEWFEGGALSSRAFDGDGDEYTSYPKALMSVQGGKKYTTKSFVNDVNTLGKLLPKSTREAMTAKANTTIAGSGRPTSKRGRPISKRGELIKKIMSEMGVSLGQASKIIKEKGLY